MSVFRPLTCKKDSRTGRLLTLLDCSVGDHTGHFSVHIIRRADGSRTTACDRHLPEVSGR